ncbi:MAG: hypothetical protein DRG80_02915 [Deltaproteobacteria bacterium]|nr:MAG: hypothetical protein DRG80_02915 [Deltaproteobacteria bacterium]
MATSVIKSVQTQGIGFAPILKYYFEKCGISQIIDDYVPLDPRRKVLSHGQACVAMITAILFQVLQLYRLCKFADATTVLDVILPGIAPEEYFDDRLADTLNAIYNSGIGNLEIQITQKMIHEFDLQCPVCHNDTTSVSVYGQGNANKTADSIKITYGYNKKHRQDLKQFVWSLKDVRNPKTEYLLCEFEYIVQGHMRLPDGNTYGFVSELNSLQQDILAILQVPAQCYSYEYLFDTQ